MISFENSPVTSKDITKLRKYELVDLVLSMMTNTDIIIDSFSGRVDGEELRNILVFSGDDVFTYVEVAVDRSRADHGE